MAYTIRWNLFKTVTEMSSLKLSLQDKRELEKFTKFLALKAIQIIVQSRCGYKITTKCKPNASGTDWFNLAINDITEIMTDAKRQISDDIISSSVPLCVEISLRTNENDTMVLETWNLGVLPEQSDPTLRVTYAVYNRMGILLKSLLSVSRITPAYKLSRRQIQDSYIICYRIYKGEPAVHDLGDNYKHVKVGNLSTPIGMIHMSVFYRTKMTISPTQTGRSIMLKSDHFHTDIDPRLIQQNDNDSRSLNDIIKVGAFVDTKLIPKKNDDSDENIPFSSLLTPRQTLSSSPLQSTESTNTTKSVTTMSKIPINTSSNGNEQSACNSITPKCNSQNGSRRSSCSMTSTNDDYIMVDLKTPFATTNTNSDLGAFYRECQTAPPLQAFMEEKTLAEQVGDLTKQLEVFETSIHHYEDIWNSICKSKNNN